MFGYFFIIFSELVKHGKQVAIIEITLRNYGSYPFQPDDYGKSIIVERKILATGGGGYKIKSANGNFNSFISILEAANNFNTLF